MASARTSELTRQHRRVQLALRAATLRDLLRLWPAFDVENIPGTWPAFERALVLLIQARGPISSGLASRYFREHRAAAGVVGTPPPPHSTPTEEQVVTGLRVAGPLNAGTQLAKGRAAGEVAKATLVNVAGTVGMYALDYGRDTLMNAVNEDEKALGWGRMTSGDPCAFCAMLASRGPVYGSSETASFEAHRSCACLPEPMWSEDQEWSGQAREFRAIWDRATEGLKSFEGGTPADQLRAFRRVFEGR